MSDEENVDETQPLLEEVEQEQADNTDKQVVVGLVFMGISALLFSIMSTSVKVAGLTGFDATQIVIMRSAIQLTCGLIACLVCKVNPLGSSHYLLLVTRGFCGAIGVHCFFFTLTNMPLGDGTTIFFINPILTSLLAVLFLNERIGVFDAVAMVACFVGTVLVVQPEFMFGKHDDSSVHFAYPRWIPSLAAIAGALLGATSYCIVRFVGKRVHFLVQVVYFGLASLIWSVSLLLVSQGSIRYIPFNSWTTQQWLIMAAVGFSAFIAQCFLNSGLQKAPAGIATLMRNLDGG